ncbi:phosphopantetheine-binding protein [Rhizobiaceae bacterium BDR2-2]|uniref:Phosphopantetheine-binding protein n=1 Tax=Ectorhizobium quercum TaxID=2965071 RepID=A0AAE3MX84_9HYPH|nr:phosphopantetheine-binding protein [Ectorhizobium quercum]MCX8995982.1 phosphopantetheine-binding protein [Ectorhizobium quercum]
MTITLERMRADIAALVHLEPEEIGLDDNLMDLGLDSMRLLNLIMMWEQAGVDLDFGTFAERFTLAAWWEAVEARQGGQGDADAEAADGVR